jgi:hypothetical protein
MGRAVFESALIVFGILAGLALNEWRAGRDRAARASEVLSMIRSEVESNLKLLDEANAYNAEIVAKLRVLVAAKSKTIPPETYPHGLMSKPQLVSAAWTSAQTAGVLNDLPIETVLLLGRAYESQRDYLNEMSTLLNNLYAGCPARSGEQRSGSRSDRRRPFRFCGARPLRGPPVPRGAGAIGRAGPIDRWRSSED